METFQVLEDIFENGETLINARFFEDSEYKIIYGLHLKFSISQVYISVCSEDDTVIIGEKFPEDFDIDLYQLIDPKPWIDAYGSSLIWYWYMENNQAYQDGIQLEFRNIENGCRLSIQIIGIASRLSIRTVVESF